MPINDLVFRPVWFITTESLFEIISLLVTFLISWYSYKVYKLIDNKKYFYLSVGFFSMFAGFAFKIFSNSVIVFFRFFINLAHSLPFIQPAWFYTGSLVLYAFFILSGYAIFSYLSLGGKNRKVLYLFLAISLLCAILIRQVRSFTFFYFFAFVLLMVHIVPYMYDNYIKQKSNSSFLVLLGFLFLAVANLVFVGVTIYKNDLYIIGHIISLFAYILLLINLVWVLKK